MRISLFVFILFSLLGCNESPPKVEEVPVQKPAKIKEQKSTSAESKTIANKVVPPQNHKYYYVSAISGLNYRDTPKGKVLGKFPLNSELKAIEQTKIFDKINDDGKTLDGEWLGIEKGKDTVYVFNAFLSNSMTFSDITIFYAGTSYDEYNETTPGFVNLSDIYPWNHETETPTILSEKDLGKKIIPFNQKQRNIFLKKINISENEMVYLYNISKDSIYTFEVQNLTAIAMINVYADGDENIKEYNYEFGFSLGEKYKSQGETFAYIGTENPFQTGKIKSIVWKKITQQDIPVILKSKTWFDKTKIKEVYNFTTKNLNYYILDMVEAQRLNRYLIVIDSNTDEVIYKDVFMSSESIYLYPLNTGNKDTHHDFQWTGEIFKNKPPIVYGFTGNSFGCSFIDFVGKSEPPVRILCDNRH